MQVRTLGGGHSTRVRSMAWNSDALSTGDKEGTVVLLWDRSGRWLHSFRDHKAAVRALAWCPFHNYLLATGGGKLGGCIDPSSVNIKDCGARWTRVKASLHGSGNNSWVPASFQIILYLSKYPSVYVSILLRAPMVELWQLQLEIGSLSSGTCLGHRK